MLDVIVIGGGQCGLAMGYWLQKHNLSFSILERATRIGDNWRQRYDSLTLFTPSHYSALPGFGIPLPADVYLTKDQIGNYLEAYSKWFQFDIKLETPVHCVTKRHDVFDVHTATGVLSARTVVVATSALNQPYVPEFAPRLDPATFQTHSAAYRNPDQLPPGKVLVVGIGNSGAQIAEELSSSRQVSLSFGKMPRLVPQRRLGKDIFWWIRVTGQWNKVATSTPEQPVDDRVPESERKRVRRAMGLIGSRVPKFIASGDITPKARAVGEREGSVLFEDGSVMRPDSIVWATGFSHDFGWIDLPAFDAAGYPVHIRGASKCPGLYFIGLPNLHTISSTNIGKAGDDARFIVETIAAGR